MPSLLSLPRELRDEIIDQVLISVECPPPFADPPTTSPALHYKDWTSDLAPRWDFSASHSSLDRAKNPDDHFKGGNVQPAALGLSWTNHQLRAETLQRAARLHVPFVADVVYLSKEPSPSFSDRCTCHMLPFRGYASDLHDEHDPHFTDRDTTARHPPAAEGLLLTNHQLRSETLQRLRHVTIPYVVDIVIMGGFALLPTWLTHPPPIQTHIIPELVLNIRMHDAYGRHEKDYMSELMYSLEEYILRFLAVGPMCRMPEDLYQRVLDSETYSPQYAVKSLKVNIAQEPVLLRDGCKKDWIHNRMFQVRGPDSSVCWASTNTDYREEDEKELDDVDEWETVSEGSSHSKDSFSVDESESVRGSDDDINNADVDLSHVKHFPNGDCPQWLYRVLEYMISDYCRVFKKRDPRYWTWASGTVRMTQPFLHRFSTVEIKLEGRGVSRWDVASFFVPQPEDDEIISRRKVEVKRVREQIGIDT